MSDEAPTSFVNPFNWRFRERKPIVDAHLDDLKDNDRYLYEVLESKAAGENQQNHGHAHGALSDRSGLIRRRCIWRQLWPHRISVALNSSTYSFCAKTRTMVGPFARIWCDLYLNVSPNPGASVKFRLTRYDALENTAQPANGTARVTDANFYAPSWPGSTWHTITGDSDRYSGGWVNQDTGTRMIHIEAPSAVTAYASFPPASGEMLDRCELELEALASSGTPTLYLYGIAVHEAIAADEGTVLIDD